MRTANEIVSKLKEHQPSTPSKWRENAEWRMANKSWLRYSQLIAMMMLDRMEELHMSQKQLSELMGCSQQYVSKVRGDRRTFPSKHSTRLSNALISRLLQNLNWFDQYGLCHFFLPHPSSLARRGPTSPPKYFGFAEVLHARQCSNAFVIALA